MKQQYNNETQQHTTTLRVYVASLADYNAGRLHGRWLDVTEDANDLRQGIAEMLAESTEPVAEEWAIHDHEGFGPLRISEWHDLDHLAAIAASVKEHGELFLHVLHALDDERDTAAAAQCLAERYAGEFPSLAEWVEEFMHETAGESLRALPPVLQYCIDWEHVAREFELSGDIFTIEIDGAVHVFWNA